VHTEKSDVWHPDKSPFLAGPEFDNRPLLWSLRRRVKISKTNTSQVGRQADQDMPINRCIKGRNVQQIIYYNNNQIIIIIGFLYVQWISAQKSVQ